MGEKKTKKNTYLSFSLGNEIFAVNVKHTLKILQLPEITKVPESPPKMAGIINHHGSVIPVFDINSSMGLKENKYNKYSCVIILSASKLDEKNKLGLVVDEVLSVEDIDDENVNEAPKIGETIKLKSISGIFEKNASFVMILDVNDIFEQLKK